MKLFLLISVVLLTFVIGLPCHAAPYQWPLRTPFSIINTISTLQYYGPMPGFHHGLDLKAPAGTPVYAPVGGMIGMGYYYPRIKVPYTYGIFIIGDDGNRWEFHHVDPKSVPKEIVDLAKKHGHVVPGTLLARIYDATKLDPGIPAHLHVNIIDRKGFYQNPLNHFPSFVSKNRPRVKSVYLVDWKDRVVAGWKPGMDLSTVLRPKIYELVLDISDVLGKASVGDSLRRLSVFVDGARIGKDDFSQQLPKKSIFEGVHRIYKIDQIVLPDGRSITNQTDLTKTRRFLYRFNLDLRKVLKDRDKKIKLMIYAQDFAKNSITQYFDFAFEGMQKRSVERRIGQNHSKRSARGQLKAERTLKFCHARFENCSIKKVASD